MMQEYDDDFFFEEDKINPITSDTVNDLLIPVEENASASVENQLCTENVPEIKLIEEEIQEVVEAGSTECIYNDLRQERYRIHHQDLMGMTVTSGSVVLNKDEKNLIGISIGGGAPLCPCLYIVQIFDNTPASKEGTLQSGDELVGVNGQTVKGKTKVEVAKMIQAAKETVTINYNKLHADPRQGKSLDIVMKKMKHRLVENMSSGAADALGLSRAILCNDTLLAKLDDLRRAEGVYRRLVEHAKRMLKSYFELLQTYKSMGDTFACIGVREPQPRASEAFTKFGQYHRLLERDGILMLKALKPILADMGTYLTKAIPDTKLTIRKYADTKFEYLSYCLKVKEMDDEECSYGALQEPLYRVETGNYEYRLILRCRGEARRRFARLRADVLEKLELLHDKRARDTAHHLTRFIAGLAAYHTQTLSHLSEHAALFPIEVDLSQNCFQYKSLQGIQDNPDDDEDLEYGKEIKEYHDLSDGESKEKDHRVSNRRQLADSDGTDSTHQLLPDFDIDSVTHVKTDSDNNDNLSLLTELGLADDFGEFQNGLMDDMGSKSSDVDDVFEKLLSDLNTGK